MEAEIRNNDLIDDDSELLALEKLLSAADDVEKKENDGEKSVSAGQAAVPRLREDTTFAEAFSYEVNVPGSKLREMEAKLASNMEELDSSDDEEVKNFLERKYNEYGCGINKQLKQKRAEEHEAKVSRDVFAAEKSSAGTSSDASTTVCHIKNPHNPVKRHSYVSSSFLKAVTPQASNVPSNQTSGTTAICTAPTASAIFTDPVFGMRIINPLVSSALLQERMAGRKAVPFAQIGFHTQHGDLTKDWVIAGALINKSPVRTSKKGDPFSIWRLSDLRGEIQTVSLFLFKGANKKLWKTAQGMCVAVLNPNVFEKRAERGDVACLSIDTAQKVMVLGQSKDLGVCKARKKNGEACTVTVNLSECDYCIYHMKQEYGKMSRRSELQSCTAGRGLNELRNKVLGKSEVFYGGQSFTAVPAKKSAKLVQKDLRRMSSLSEYAVSPFASSTNHISREKPTCDAIPYAVRAGPVSKVASNVEVSTKQRLKDLERLKNLQAELPSTASVCGKPSASSGTPSATISMSPSTSACATSTVADVPDKFKNRAFSFVSCSPKLSRENFCIEVHVGERQAQAAKLKAAQILKQKPIEKVNPNSVRGSQDGKRRAIDELNEKFIGNDAKRRKMEKEEQEAERKSRIQRIIDATSSHTNLVDLRAQQEQDKYFSKLEKKEALEEKMLNTYKMPCKAVICLRCKYTAFSAADRCKEEKHPLKVIDAEKRFFQCKDCGNRTASVFKLPHTSCKTCKGSRWERTGMIRERKVCNTSEVLSVRGDEEKFMGSLASTANLNLLVPDEDH